MPVAKPKYPARMASGEEAFCGFLEYINRLSPSTRYYYGVYVKRFLAAAPEHLADITVEDVERFLMSLSRNLKASSCNVALNALRSFFGWLESYYGFFNPAAKIKPFKPTPPKQRILTKEEYQKLIAHTTGQRRDTLIFLASSGVRASELLALRSTSIDSDFINVYGQKTRRWRKVPINHSIRAILETNPDFFMKLPKSRQLLYKLCRKAARQSNISAINPHALRHFFCTQLLTGGGDKTKAVPLSHVARLMGDRVETVIHVYSHLTDSDLLGSTDCLD